MSLNAAATNANDLLQNSFHGVDTTGANIGMGIPTCGLANGVSGGCTPLENVAGGHNTFVSTSCINGSNSGGNAIAEHKNNQHSCTLDVYQCDLNVLDSSGPRNIKYEKYEMNNENIRNIYKIYLKNMLHYSSHLTNNNNAVTSVNRSESYKECASQKRNRSQRKTSDPSLTSRPK